MDEKLSAKIKETGDLIHELDADNLDLSNDEIIAVAVELLEMVVIATMDENTGVTASDVEKIKANKVKIEKYLTGFIGDADKTAAFIETTLGKINGGDVSE